MSDSSGILWPGDYRVRSEHALRGVPVACSLAMHLTLAALAILWPLWQGPRINLSQAFMVSLVEAPPSLPAAAPKGRPEAKAKEPEPAKPAPPQESKADARLVEALPPKPKPAKKEPKPEAKPEPKAKEEPGAEKALAKEKVPAAQQRETQLAQALERIRTRVERETALSAAISKVRERVGTDAGGADAGSGVVAGDFAGGEVPLSFRLYYEEVWARIRDNWALPSLRQQQLKTVVAIRIARDGAIERIELEDGSGDERFDRSALSAVRAANPLPPLPGDYLGRWHEIGIRFHQ